MWSVNVFIASIIRIALLPVHKNCFLQHSDRVWHHAKVSGLTITRQTFALEIRVNSATTLDGMDVFSSSFCQCVSELVYRDLLFLCEYFLYILNDMLLV